jgi:hypothetical protein
MGKVAPDAAIDGGLNYVDGSDYMCVCSQEPTSYTDAYTTSMLARVAMAAGDIVLADDTSGRKATMGAKAGVTITNSGTATHVALVNTGDSSLRYITTCTSQALVAGGTVDIPSWKINIQDPT